MIVSFKCAKFLKSLGYDKDSLQEYWVDGSKHFSLESEVLGNHALMYPAPEIFEAINWLWLKDIAKIDYFYSDGNCSPYINEQEIKGKFNSPEEALNEALELLSSKGLGFTI